MEWNHNGVRVGRQGARTFLSLPLVLILCCSCLQVILGTSVPDAVYAQDSSLSLQSEADRWRLLFPGARVRPRTPIYDPYNPNVLKGDYPIYGEKTFFAMTGIIDTFWDFKQNLDFTRRDASFFREDNVLRQTTEVLTLEVFHGDTVFAPKDWALRVTPIFRWRCGDRNNGKGNGGTCGEEATLFETFGELKLFEIGNTFDPTSARLGLQGFNADFFGLIYNDVQPGLRFFSEIARNQFKVNVAVFDRLNKNALTALNEFDRREHQVGILNVEWDDFLFPGFNILPNFVVNHDDDSALKQKGSLRAYYLGLDTNGRVERFNVNSAVSYVLGDTGKNTPNKRSQDISAGMAFLQVTYPFQFVNPRLAFAYASGDGNPNDNTANGFDSVFDNINFGGGQFSYLFGEKIQLGKTTVLRGNSIFPSLRGANARSQFVNPGVIAINPGIDVALTPKTIFECNLNYARFENTATLRATAKGRHVSSELGWEANMGLTYRPFLNEQVILFAGGGVFFPGTAVSDLFGSRQTVYKFLIRAILVF